MGSMEYEWIISDHNTIDAALLSYCRDGDNITIEYIVSYDWLFKIKDV